MWLAILPFFHVFGMTVSMNFPLFIGASMVLMPDPRDTSQLLKNIIKHRVTVFPGAPAHVDTINNYPGIHELDLTNLKASVSGSAPLPVEVLEKFERVTGSKIVEGFGLTEASPVTHSTALLGRRKVGTIGIPIPETDAKVVDLEDGTTEMPPGKEGELVVRGPQVMKAIGGGQT